MIFSLVLILMKIIHSANILFPFSGNNGWCPLTTSFYSHHFFMTKILLLRYVHLYSCSQFCAILFALRIFSRFFFCAEDNSRGGPIRTNFLGSSYVLLIFVCRFSIKTSGNSCTSLSIFRGTLVPYPCWIRTIQNCRVLICIQVNHYFLFIFCKVHSASFYSSIQRNISF